jgi:hypothetical protein
MNRFYFNSRIQNYNYSLKQVPSSLTALHPLNHKEYNYHVMPLGNLAI